MTREGKRGEEEEERVSAQPRAESVGGVDAELEGILAAARSQLATNKPAIAKMTYSHEAMVDIIVANPGISQNAIADMFGYTPSWISQIITSDTFQTALAKRREQLVDPLLRATLEGEFKALVARSLDILQQKLNRPALEIPDNLALRALEIGSRAAGYGAKDLNPPQQTTPAEVHIHLEQLGGGLVALLQRKKREADTIDVTPETQSNENSKGSESAALQIAQLTNSQSEE